MLMITSDIAPDITMRGKSLAALTLIATIIACTPQPPPRGPVVIGQLSDPDSLQAVLSDAGFTVTITEPNLQASLSLTPDDPRANCQTIYLRDHFGERGSRGRFVDADQVIIKAVTTTNNTLSLSAQGRYLNRFDNRRTTNACEVSADFEAELKRLLNAN